MLRSTLAAAAGAAFGALAIAPVRERIQDQLWQPVEACSVGLVALVAALLAVLVMAMREPRCRCKAITGLTLQTQGAPTELSTFTPLEPVRRSPARPRKRSA